MWHQAKVVLAHARRRGCSGGELLLAHVRRHGSSAASGAAPSGGNPATATRSGGTLATTELVADGRSPSLAAWWRTSSRGEAHGSGSAGRPPRISEETTSRLTAELESWAKELQPPEAQLLEMNAFLDALQHQVDQIIEGTQVLPFGSAVNGFWTAQSDVDVCIKVPRASTRSMQVKVLRDLAQALSRVKTYQLEPRYGANVPILHWSPRQPGKVSCDISVNNLLAVVNSQLLGDYVRLDERVRTLGFCVKAWVQARGINDRSRGTLSSFSLILMLIHFLQRRETPVLPSLQDIAFSQSMPTRYVNGVDCRFCTDPELTSAELQYLQKGKPPNAESTGVLLLEFFRYFGHEYRQGIIRIRDTRSQLPPRDESGLFLYVDNPFEVGKDVANVDEAQRKTIRKEFRRAWALLKEGRAFRDLLRDPTIADAVLRRR